MLQVREICLQAVNGCTDNLDILCAMLVTYDTEHAMLGAPTKIMYIDQ
jgi:hypothetical protein